MSVYPFGTSPEQRVSLGVKDPSGIDLDHRVAVSTPICRVIAFPRLEPGQRRSGHTKEVWKHLLVAQIPETGLTLAVWRPVDNCRDTGVRDRWENAGVQRGSVPPRQGNILDPQLGRASWRE